MLRRQESLTDTTVPLSRRLLPGAALPADVLRRRQVGWETHDAADDAEPELEADAGRYDYRSLWSSRAFHPLTVPPDPDSAAAAAAAGDGVGGGGAADGGDGLPPLLAALAYVLDRRGRAGASGRPAAQPSREALHLTAVAGSVGLLGRVSRALVPEPAREAERARFVRQSGLYRSDYATTTVYELGSVRMEHANAAQAVTAEILLDHFPWEAGPFHELFLQAPEGLVAHFFPRERLLRSSFAGARRSSLAAGAGLAADRHVVTLATPGRSG
jgi:hypothetical protein